MKKGTGMRRFMIMAMVRKNGKCVKVEMISSRKTLSKAKRRSE